MMNIRSSISTLFSRNDLSPMAPGASNSADGMLALTLASIGLLVLAGCSPRDLDSSSVDTGPSTDSGQEEAVAVIVEGRSIMISEIDEHMKDQFLEEFLKQPEERRFEMRETAVRDLVQRRAIEDEAKKQGKT